MRDRVPSPFTSTAAITVTVMAAAVLLSGCGSNQGSTTATSAPPSPPASATTATATPTSTPTADAARQVASWYEQGGRAKITALSDSARKTAKSANDPVMQSLGCLSVAQKAGAAQVYPPIPDTQAQASWSKALTQLQQGGYICSDGVQKKNTARASQGMATIQHGLTDLTTALSRINAVLN
ncbi:hypothetical protein ACIRP7_02365 [Streptomyces sp. NPDC102270]|uniref:hypothetical protein n=1 Tax=Streptomyces sp. NPDC102270 TaxID=3366150 RepID=UPI0038028711